MIDAEASRRLSASRERVRAALGAQAAGTDASPGSDAPAAAAAEAAIDALRDWWMRHPLALVALAAVGGALFVWSRPWRWLISPLIIAGLLPRVIARAVSQVSAPVWMALLAALFKPAPKAR